jgi:hypothetical protein
MFSRTFSYFSLQKPFQPPNGFPLNAMMSNRPCRRSGPARARTDPTYVQTFHALLLLKSLKRFELPQDTRSRGSTALQARFTTPFVPKSLLSQHKTASALSLGRTFAVFCRGKHETRAT